MEIIRLNPTSWLITVDGIPFVVNAEFSPAKNFAELSEDEKNAHKAEFFIVTQGRKKHFDLSSYKYISLDKTILIPPEYLTKVSKFLPHQLIGMASGEIFNYKTLKVTATATGNSFFDPFLLNHANCYVYRIEGNEGCVIVSGYTATSNTLKSKVTQNKKQVYLVPFSSKSVSGLQGGPLLDVLKMNEVYNNLGADFLIPFSEDLGNVTSHQMAPMVKGQEHENKILFIETGNRVSIN